jgi:hypothetical protein
MMRINWMDFPEMIRFSNSIDAALYVSYLKFPPAYALWNLPEEDLKQIRSELQGLDFPESNYAQRNNARCYRDLLTFLENAEKDSRTRGSDEMIPMSATHGKDYLDLIPSRFSFTAEDSPPTTRDRDDAYDSAHDYLTAIRDEYSASEWQTVSEKLSAAIELCDEKIDPNRIYRSLLSTPKKQVLDDLSRMTAKHLADELKALATEPK